MSKILVVLCDGTGNSPEADAAAGGTNIVVLRNMLGVYMLGRRSMTTNYAEGWEIDQYQAIEESTEAEHRKFVFYDRGLGAPQLDASGKLAGWSWQPQSFFANAKLVHEKFLGLEAQLAASGIIDKVAQAYRFLVQYYEPGDQIFMFGFSRGAYELRLLVTMIRYIGLLDRNKFATVAMLHAAIEQGFNLYNADLNPDMDDNPAKAFRAQYAIPVAQPIDFLGLFDTVPGLVPERVRNDRRLSSVVKVARHAIAADERRSIYRAQLWVPSAATDSTQVWFPGVHSDIGGGYPSDESGLSRVALNWMVEEANKFDLRINPLVLQQYKPDPLAIAHDSFNAFVNGTDGLRFNQVCTELRRPICITTDESWHPSIKARLEAQAVVKDGSAPTKYSPANIVHSFNGFRNAAKSVTTEDMERMALIMPDAGDLSDADEDTDLLKGNFDADMKKGVEHTLCPSWCPVLKLW